MAALSKGQDRAAIEASRARAKKRRPLERERLKANKARRAKYVADKKAAALVASESKPAIGVRDRWLEQKASQRQPMPKWPASIEQLTSSCGPYGDTVAAVAKLAAAQRWACNGLTAPGHACSNPEAVIYTSLVLYRAQLWKDAGVETRRIPASQDVATLLDDLSPDSRFEALLVVNETIAEWEAAGSPGLDQPTLYLAYKHLVGRIWSGELAPFNSCPTDPHI
ncbi:hypothetical protein M2337_001626 [Sphingobium sp. B2D3A]|uniref:hypothetical protein n=1 Tax=unclassified Sphingobium TaxID=2611147 RepID=UPI002224F6E0|nr:MULTISPECIES: hypothetical protein [unclassified Sphingobium]MCW2337393.1 hypothetical protein [Sphingobium sp. B2D3A]MCW2383851.1 hypothetical protein [Sphingobium sp. B2D3D]